MELEQRVQAIEQELQILKNQIQAALLEIQEHLLTNAYPALRSEEQAQQPAPQMRTQQVQRPVNEDFFDEGPALNMRKVSSNATDTRSRAESNPPPKRQSAPLNTQEIDLTSLTELEDWTIQKIEQMGPERTRALIQVYSDKGRFTPEICEALLHFVELYAAANAATTTPTKGAAKPGTPSPRQTQPYQPVRATSQQPAVSSKKAAPGAKTITQTQNAPSVHDPFEAPSIPKPVVKQTPAANNGKGKSATKSTPKAKDAPPEAKGQSSLVLRLIAGVQNAGAGVRWKKEDDENG
jgi:hypothetical protein